MKFTKSLIKGKFIKRYKRFFADIKLNKETITAHCPNTGSMMGLLSINNDAWISKNNDSKRKLKFTLEIIKVNITANAAIIVIGNEILSGRTQDTNTGSISLWLNSLGVKVEEVRIIPDIEELIVTTINKTKKKYNYVFTTGGIGPTHDDITAKSISKAFGLKYEIHKEAFKILEKYYVRFITFFYGINKGF